MPNKSKIIISAGATALMIAALMFFGYEFLKTPSPENPPILTHQKWEANGRIFKTQYAGRSVYEMSLGQQNVDLGNGQFAPYVWDEEEKIVKFADAELRFKGAILEYWQGQEKLSAFAFNPEIKTGDSWTRDNPVVSNPSIKQMTDNSVELSYILTTKDAEAEIIVKAGSGQAVRFGTNFRAKTDGLEQRISVDFGEKLNPLEKKDRHGNSLPTTAFTNGKIVWAWDATEQLDHEIEQGATTKVGLGRKVYALNEQKSIFPDVIGPLYPAVADDDWMIYYSSGWGWISNGYNGDNYYGRWSGTNEPAGQRFTLPSAIPSGATINSATFSLMGYTSNAIGVTWVYVTDDDDAPQVLAAGGRPVYAGGGSTVTYPNTAEGAGAVQWDTDPWNYGSYNSVEIKTLIQHLVDTYGGLASGAHIVVWVDGDDGETANDENGLRNYEGGVEAESPKLTITFTDEPDCGDGICSGLETHASCPADCPYYTQINSPKTNFMTEGLVGYWSFDGAAMGTTSATDLSSNDNTGWLQNGVKKTIGISGQALEFDGGDDYVDAGNGLSLDFGTNSFSMSFWMKTIGYPTGYQGEGGLITKPDGAYQEGWYTYFNDSGQVGIYARYDATHYGYEYSSGVSLNRWYHFVILIDRTANKIRVFRDGVMSDTGGIDITGWGNIDSVGDDLLMGDTRADNLSPYNGILDEVRVYSRALTPSEITDLYRAGAAKMQVNAPSSALGGATSSLVGYWSFNGPDINGTDIGGTVYDRSGQNNHGTILYSPTKPVIGKIGQALEFHPSADISVTGPTLTNTHTVSMWLNPCCLGGSGNTFFSAGGADPGIGFNSTEGGYKLSFFWTATNHFANTFISNNVWYHIAVVNDSGSVTFYLNGQNDGSASGAPGYTVGEIGLGYSFEGKIDEVRVYNRALSASEVYDLYRTGTARLIPTRPSAWSCGDSVTFTYKGSSVTYGTVSSQGECWLDRNLGASQVATAYNDSNAYGDLFQWGRLDDGHQTRTSNATTTLSSVDNPGHDKFIYGMGAPYDWRSPQNDNLWQGVSGTNNPCPAGWRIPTETECDSERTSWGQQNYNGAYASPLKLTVGGYRNESASLTNVGSDGYYWSSIVAVPAAMALSFNSGLATMYGDFRVPGFSVRCIKN